MSTHLTIFKTFHLMRRRTIFDCAWIFILSMVTLAVYGQAVSYTLSYNSDSQTVSVMVKFPPRPADDVSFVIPRSAPGTYSLTNYQAYVENVKAETKNGDILIATKGRGSFYLFTGNQPITQISYELDIPKMEAGLLSGSDSSKARKNYLGLLGYSVFGFVDGIESQSIALLIKGPKGWPVFSTLSPSSTLARTSASYKADNFAMLADAQYYLGKEMNVIQVKEAPIPLFVMAYSETEVDIEEIGRRGLLALNQLADYFGYIPMPHYTLCFEFLIPLSPQHEYGFSMEHLNSMTSSLDTSRAIVGYVERPPLGSIVHHIGHSWIPLRSYGKGYRPFEWGTAPLIETIWLNEGFIWYVTFNNILRSERRLAWFESVVEDAPVYIQNKSLRELSFLGSTQYALDFLIGMNLFCRGALLARDLDMRIQERSNQQKSFKDVLLGFLSWTEEHQRAFEYHEIESIISNAVDVDISDVWNRWQKPPRDN